jgi:hypothetical protein
LDDVHVIGKVEDHISTLREYEFIAPTTAGQPVITSPAVQYVAARLAMQPVVARPTIQHICVDR